MKKTIALDSEGYFLLNHGIRLEDEALGHDFLNSLTIDPYGVVHLHHQGEDILVEAFDKPYIAKQVHLENGVFIAQMPYQFRQQVDLHSLCLDAWDRLHGRCANQIPFVLSHAAQADLFQNLESFTDQSLRLFQQDWPTPPYYQSGEKVEPSSFWSDRYQETPSPGWNLESPHPELQSALAQIKPQPSRILVPGCGFGHDAAWLAQQGHFVTALDFSQEALDGARKRYGHLPRIDWIQGDVFTPREDWVESFDLIVEHTCYCAVNPVRREELLKLYSRLLTQTGHLLGIFFVVPKRSGPYFGGSEWELERELESRFRFLYWTRLKHSPGWRKGAELMVYAQKRDKTPSGPSR